MPLIINVPFKEKELAKAKGARWDQEEKTWFIPDHLNLNDFQEWINTLETSIVAKTPYYIAVNERNCWKCHTKTPVIAFASHDFYVYEPETEDDPNPWSQAECFSFFSMPTFIDPHNTKMLNDQFPFYRPGYSKTAEHNYWANHCTRCNAIQGDFHMHEEPEGEFCPIDIEQCKKLTLMSVRSKFDLEIQSTYGFSSNEDMILTYAKRIG